MSGNRRFDRSLKRRTPTIEPHNRILVVCEGAVTEPDYFVGLRLELRNRLLEIEIVPTGGVPISVVNRAIELKREADRTSKRFRDDYLRFDEVWGVIDVDEHPRLADAREKAKAHGIRLAISNPCFELWVLLHFQDQRSEQSRHVIQRLCAGFIPNYNKHLEFSKLWPLYGQAIARAEALDKWQQEAGRIGGNPSTGVYTLVQTLLKMKTS